MLALSLVDTSLTTAHLGALVGGVRLDKVPSILFLAGFELSFFLEYFQSSLAINLFNAVLLQPGDLLVNVL